MCLSLFKDSFDVNLSWIPDDDSVTGSEGADAGARDAIPPITFLLLLGMFTYFQKIYQLCHVIHLSAYISVTPTGWISMKFGIGDLYENMSRKSKCS